MDSELDQQKRENLLKVVALIEENAPKIASALRNEEIVGQLGVEKPFAPEKTEEELTEQIRSICGNLRADLEEADEVWQVIVRFLNQTGFGKMVELNREVHEAVEEIPDIVIFGLGFLTSHVVSADEHAGTNFQDVQSEFLETLVAQEKLEDANSAIVEYWLGASNQQQVVSYFNTFMTTARRTLSDLKTESSKQDISDSVDIYREASTIYEDALPIVTAVCKELENGAANIQNIDGMGPRDCKKQLEAFPSLVPYIEHYDVDIRNAVSHGGNSGVIENHMAERITFQYEDGEELKEKKMDFGQFKQKASRVASASVSLLILPLFLIHMEGFIEIRDGILDSL